MTGFKNRYLSDIKKSIKAFFKREKSQDAINNWQSIALAKLENLVLKGKLLRGCFVILGSAIYSKKIPKDTFELAAVIEIFHTAFLIHDDIMDKEKTRRGEASIHEQFKNLALHENLSESELFGQAMAINTGDMAIFLGLKAFNYLNLDPEIKNNMTQLITEEMIKLGAAQMQDVYLGVSQKKVTEEQIINMYKYKTAGYSFVLPLKLGMLLSGHKNTSVEKLGELLGLIYQIKDDEIGIFAAREVSGKSNGLDLKQKKKTLFYKYLTDNLGSSDLKKFHSISISENLNSKLLNELILKSNTKELVNRKIQSIVMEYKKLLNSSGLSSDIKLIFNDLLEYSLNRQK